MVENEKFFVENSYYFFLVKFLMKQVQLKLSEQRLKARRV